MPAEPPPTPSFSVAEIDRMLHTLAECQRIVDAKCRPAHEALIEITQRWESVLRQYGAWETAAKLVPVRDAVRAAAKEIDKVLSANRHDWDEMRPTIYEGPNPPGHGLDSAISMLVDALHELAGGQNIDVSKWARPRFEETATLGVRYGEWTGQATSRIGHKTNQLREMRCTA